MRIGLVSPPWVPVPPRAYGGLEAVVDRLARGLAATGHEVLLAAPANSDCSVPRVEGLDEVDPDAPITGDSVTELAHVVRAYAAMTEVDVIHDHTLAGPLYRHRPRGIPVVVTNHGPFEPKLKRLYSEMDRDTAVVAISHNQASTADGVRIARVIHHGLDLERVPVGQGRGDYAAFLGRMHPNKGAREAILLARAAGVPLRMAAKMREDAEYEYYKQAVAPLLGNDVEYLGEVNEVEKYELLGDAMGLLNPIQWAEPFGLVMIEALACGTPVVATAVGSVPEIIDHGRTGFVSDDVNKLVEALTRANELDRSECRQAAENRFSTERMVSDHLDLYAELLDEEDTQLTA